MKSLYQDLMNIKSAWMAPIINEMNIFARHFLVFINPAGGSGRAMTQWQRVQPFFRTFSPKGQKI